MPLPSEPLLAAVLQLLLPLQPAATAAPAAASAAPAASMALVQLLFCWLALCHHRLHLQECSGCQHCMEMTALLQEPTVMRPNPVLCYCFPQTS
jgi:hypothetical protein